MPAKKAYRKSGPPNKREGKEIWVDIPPGVLSEAKKGELEEDLEKLGEVFEVLLRVCIKPVPCSVKWW